VSPSERIRPIAIAVVRRGGDLLVFEAYDSIRRHAFYRPLGGEINFGERSQDAIAREMREEIGAEIRAARLIATLENIFAFEGRLGHEIVFVYEASLVDERLYAADELTGYEENGTPFRVLWKPLGSFGPGAPLYPDGLLDLLTTGSAPRQPWKTGYRPSA
jgi:ADP-ribose pyrophosphatase YjhB (NUDIX family)